MPLYGGMKERGVFASADAGRTTVRWEGCGVRGGLVLDLTSFGNYGRSASQSG